MERIHIDSGDAAWFAVESAARTASDGLEIFEAAGKRGDQSLEVCLTIEGREVPFAAVVKEMARQMRNSVSVEAAKIAYANAKLAKLDKLRDAIDQADWQIRERIQEAFDVHLPD